MAQNVDLVWFDQINRPSLRAMMIRHRENSLPAKARSVLCLGHSLWRAPSLGIMLWVTVVLLVSIGCVQRRMTVRSNPPGALVYVDDYQIGTTPVSTDFVYYGTRKIRLIKDGYDTLTVQQPFPVPWYEIFPLDFVTEISYRSTHRLAHFRLGQSLRKDYSQLRFLDRLLRDPVNRYFSRFLKG